MRSKTPGSLSVWILATRPKTLPAAVAPVIVGSAVAFADKFFAPLPAMAAHVAAAVVVTADLISPPGERTTELLCLTHTERQALIQVWRD